jgi:hypothetical protein
MTNVNRFCRAPPHIPSRSTARIARSSSGVEAAPLAACIARGTAAVVREALASERLTLAAVQRAALAGERAALAAECVALAAGVWICWRTIQFL